MESTVRLYFAQLLSGDGLETFYKNKIQFDRVMERHGTPIHMLTKNKAENGLDLVTPYLFIDRSSKVRQPFEAAYMSILEKCFKFHAAERPTAGDLLKDIRGFL